MTTDVRACNVAAAAVLSQSKKKLIIVQYFTVDIVRSRYLILYMYTMTRLTHPNDGSHSHVAAKCVELSTPPDRDNTIGSLRITEHGTGRIRTGPLY